MAGQVITKISASSGTHLISSSFYGTCSTAAATAAKEVIINDPEITDAITLINGMTLAVKFTYSNTVASPKITVYNNGGTAASPSKGATTLIAQKSIMRYGTTAPSTSAATSWTAGAVVLFVYDGTNWVESSSWDNDTNTTALGSMSGTLAVNHGGTGVTSNTVNSVLIGGTTTTGAIQNVAAASGALYSTGADVKPVFGTLPIAQGGTGETTATEAWTALGGGEIGKKATLSTSDIPDLSETYLPLSGGTMAGKITLPGAAHSWAEGARGDVSLYAPKDELNANHWCPFLGVQTKGGGIWTFGNYADESLVAAYFSASTIADTSRNSPDRTIQFYQDGTTAGFTVTTSQVTNLLPVQLYNNTSGTTGTVGLSQSAANFTRLRVFFTTGNAGYSSTEIWSPNGKDFTCIGASMATSSIAQIEFCKCHINGTNITRTNSGYVNIGTNNTAGATVYNQIKITRVEGYKW